MPNMHELLDSVAQIISKDVIGKVWFTSLDLKCAFSQLPLSSLISSQWNFSFLNGFKTAFYGLTDITTEFQTAMDSTLQGLDGVICYLSDILVVTIKRFDVKGWALKNR